MHFLYDCASLEAILQKKWEIYLKKIRLMLI